MKIHKTIHYICIRILFLGILILYSCTNQSIAQTSINVNKQIDSLLLVTSPRPFNGVVLVSQKGKTIYSKAYGYFDKDTRQSLKVTNQFASMSIAKQITATLVLRQVDKGTIHLEDIISKHLPDLPYAWKDSITVQQLLNNTSGLAAFDWNAPLKFKPGTDFNYSNNGYSLLGRIITKASGETLEKQVNDLFHLCKMNNSKYPTSDHNENLVKGHTIKEDGTVIVRAHTEFKPDEYPGADYNLTVSDLAKWNQALHGGKLLKPDTYQQMISYTITNAHQLFGDKPIGYGYGLRINDLLPIKEIGHTGFHPSEGFTAVNLYYPETQTSVIVMENQGYENFDIAYYFEIEIRKIVLKKLLQNKNQIKK